MFDDSASRRDFFSRIYSRRHRTALRAGGTNLCSRPKPESAKDATKPKPEEDVSPAEDLMRSMACSNA